MGVLTTSGKKSISFKIAVFIGIGFAVIAVIYFTPVPDHYPQSCSRPCHELDWPMICRVKLTLERFQTLGSACKDCPSNRSDCYLNGCITADGQARGILTVNRQFPGPTLEVCQYDIILVDIVNRVPGQGFGVHWRGQSQLETPYMDGVPMITQCPIPSLTTFQYKFRASESGTHLWQVNTGEELLDTLFGPLIVKLPPSKETLKKLYDTDDVKNIIVIHTWNPQKANLLFGDDASNVKLLINGKTEGNKVPSHVFKVSAEKRHRFRMIYVGGSVNCQIRFSIDHHEFLVIALDGRPINSKMVTSVRLSPGERLDFVLRTNQKIGSYHMRAVPINCPGLESTFATLQYEGKQKNIINLFNNDISISGSELAEISTSSNEHCTFGVEKSNYFCLHNIFATEPMPKELLADKPDLKLYFFYNSTVISSKSTFNSAIVGIKDIVKVPQTNNLTMLLPSSPLVSQSYQIAPDAFCNSNSVPQRCKNIPGSICECVHVVEIPLNAVVELILVNQDQNNHVFHLHGYSFYVIGVSNVPVANMTAKQIKDLDESNKLVQRNFNYPVIKDTIALSRSSFIVVRFKANNAGYWILDEEHSSYWSKGMSLVFKVGEESDYSSVPENFPKCGDWIGPEFFFA